MDDLIPIPFPILIRRLLGELDAKKTIFDLPSHRFFKCDAAFDLGVTIHGQRASTPFGPAAGPHTQLAQNIVLSWLAGGRFIELKTVQILDELSIARPCIDMETVGYNIEWSQELRIQQSLQEYVKAAMLIEMAKTAGMGPGFPDTVFDMSVGYDLAGIQSPKVRAFIDGMLDASALVEQLRKQIPEDHAHLRDLDYPTRISDTVTLSTFHGCPPGEIEAIAEHLLRDVGLNVVVKLNPTLLGRDDLNAILHERLDYTDIIVPDEAFANDPTWEQVQGIVDRLGRMAERLGKGFGVKFTNTLLVRNHKTFFPSDASEMYLSGPPLHVLAMTLVGRFRKVFGDRYPISFSAGIDAANYADAVALGLKPVSVCTDLLKNGGYARAFRYHGNLTRRMKALGAFDIDTFILKAFGHAETVLDELDLPAQSAAACRAALGNGEDLRAAAGGYFDAWVSAARLKNTETYCERVLDDPRYDAHQTNTPPKKTGVSLDLFDCQTCDRCITVCPNNAIFAFSIPKGDIPRETLIPDGSNWKLEGDEALTINRPHQIGVFADICNECGNCDVICPEDGGPYAIKPNFFGSRDSWSTADDRDGFFIEAVEGGTRIYGRIDGKTVTMEDVGVSEMRFRGEGFELSFDPADSAGTASGRADGPVDLAPLHIMAATLKAVTAARAVNYVSAGLTDAGRSCKSVASTGNAMKTIDFRLNGEAHRIEVEADQSALEVLRENFKIKSLKDGCAPQGQCGCCLALINGRPRKTCSLPMSAVKNQDVITLEGLPEPERQLYADAFQVAAGLQCGFCTPGFVLRIKHLTDQDHELTRDEIAKALTGHLCRCTGYVKIIDAVELIHKAKHGGSLPKALAEGGVGAPVKRYQGAELTLGTRPFVADIDVPGLLYGTVVLSPHARARVLRIDTARAEAVPGVAVVATARDVPGDRWVGLINEDWPCFVAEGEEVRYVGDVLAAIAADTPRAAREAASLVFVDYEPLAPVLDPAEALKPDAHQVNPRCDNKLSETFIERGDADAELAASAHVVSGTWQTQRIEHLFLEPESALAVPLPDGRLHLYSQGQGIFDDRMQVAAVLDEPEENLFVELVPNGGAFGGKEDMSIQAQTALLARLTGRPVRLTLSREESIRMHPKRHPITMTYTVGCDAEGRLTAAKMDLLGDSGAYASVGGKVLERAAGHSCGPYKVPALKIHAIAAYTNNPPCGAMRGFGVNQTSFAMEGCLDQLAAKVGLDGWEMRWRNAVRVGDLFSSGQILEKSVGLEKTLLAVKDAYYGAREDGHAVGIACAVKNSGIGNGAVEYGKCRLEVEADGTVSLFIGFTEMGQGLLTILSQCAAEVTGLPSSIFQPKVNSRHEVGVGQTTGSRGTLLAGRAAAAAAKAMRADLDKGLDLTQMAGKVYAGDIRIDDTTAPGQLKNGKIKTHTAFGWATQVAVLDGDGRVDRVIAAHDVGRAINPQQCEAQIEGAVHMGLGYALTEELPCKDGMPVTFDLRNIGVLRANHMPKVEVILVEDPEPEGPFGAKGVGEIGLVPTAGAVAGALEAFDGIRRKRLPMKESPAARAIKLGRIPDDDRDQWH